MADILLYGSPLSPFFRRRSSSFAVRASPSTENVPVLGMPDWYVALNPGRRIPTLRDRTLGGEGAGEPPSPIPPPCALSSAKKYPEPSFYPEDPFTLGRALWFEEFADTDLAGIVGNGIFRPIMFPRFQGQESDATAKASAVEKLPRSWPIK